MKAEQLERLAKFVQALNRLECDHRVRVDRADPIHVYPSRDQWDDLEVSAFFDDGIAIKRKDRAQ